MAETSSRTLICSVLFLDLVDYSRNPVEEQLRLKQALNLALAEALERLRQWDRVILDTGDGAAVAFLSDPEDALVAAIGIRAGAGARKLKLRLGINLGPVRLVKDLNGQSNVVGDGINDAQRVMSFAEPGQLLVSRSFHDMVSRLSDAHTKLFTREGLRTDKHVREHELYAVAEAGAEQPPKLPADRTARVFDAGPHLIVSGYDRVKVARELDRLAATGARAVSPITQVGDKWMVTCEHPDSRPGQCRVETLGYKRIVTGPTRMAVAVKVRELEQTGDRLEGEIEQDGEVWTAVCDTGGAGR
jgi:class 3 adenylate cyclase